jgi:hypothetical protein
VRFAAITLRVASQQVFIVVYFVIDSVRKNLDTPSHDQRDVAAQFDLLFFLSSLFSLLVVH